MKRFYFWFIVITVTIAIWLIACQPPTETPTISPPVTPTLVSPLPSPTPESPLPTPPVSPLAEPEAEDAGMFSVWFDEDVHVYHTGVASPTLHISVKLLAADSALVFSETQHTGLTGPDVPGTGQFGTFDFDYPPFDGQAAVWAKCEWDDAAEVYIKDIAGQLQPITEITCVYTGTQDAEEYWYYGVVEGMMYQKYLPLALKWGEVTTPTPTPTPEAGGGGTGSSDKPVWLLALEMVLLVAMIAAGIWLLSREIVRSWIRDVLRR